MERFDGKFTLTPFQFTAHNARLQINRDIRWTLKP